MMPPLLHLPVIIRTTTGLCKGHFGLFFPLPGAPGLSVDRSARTSGPPALFYPSFIIFLSVLWLYRAKAPKFIFFGGLPRIHVEAGEWGLLNSLDADFGNLEKWRSLCLP